VRRLALAGALLLAAAAMVAYVAPRLDFGTDIASFLPDTGGDESVLLSRLLRDTELSRTMILSVGAPDEASAVAAGRALDEALRGHPALAWLRSGPDPELPRQVFELYFPRRLLFLSEAPEREIPLLLSDDGLRERARQLRRDLASPAGTLLAEVAPADPLGAFRSLLERLRGAQSTLRVEQGQFLAADGRHAILFLATRESGFDTAAQRPLLRDIAAAFEKVDAAHGGSLVLEQSGLARYVVAGEARAQGDAFWIASLSFLGVGAILLASLRSAASLALTLLPGVFGILITTTIGLLYYGQLDGLTLAFGTTLLGLTIDYPIHLLNHHAMSPLHESARAVARRIAPSLGLAAGTTAASYAGLAATSLPGFRQIAFFSVVGVAATFAFTLLVLPAFLSDARRLPKTSRRAAAAFAGAVLGLEPRRRLLALLAVALFVGSMAALPSLEWQDELSALSAPDPAIVAEDQRVRGRVSPFDGSRFAVAIGETPEQAVERNDRVYEALSASVERGELAGLRSLHDLLWSVDLQERNWRAVAATPDLAGRVERAFAAEGFRPEALRPFRESLAAGAPAPLRLGELRASELGGLAGPMILDLGERTGVVTLLRGLEDPGALSQALSEIPGVRLFDQTSFITGVYREFRDATVRQMLLGSGLVLGVLFLRYWSLRLALAAFLPSTLVALGMLASFALLGVRPNLLHAMSLVLVTGQGSDYGIFVVDSADRARDFRATMLSLVVSCFTTICAYGTLAFSEEPALRAIGLVTGVGILLCLLLSPLTFLLLARRPPQPELELEREAEA
jgi:predicted exporter